MKKRKPYRKVPKSTPHYEGLEPYEFGHLEARDAMQHGQPKPVGHYLREVADILELIANRLDPGDGAHTGPRLKFVRKREPRSKRQFGTEVLEWDSTHLDVRGCIVSGAAEPVGWYLRDVAEALGILANILDPTPTGKEGWCAKFVRKSRGRPKGGAEKMLEDDGLKVKIWEEAGKGFTKKESALSEIGRKTGWSRATILRAISRRKGR